MKNGLLVQKIYDSAGALLSEAKERRNWGGIGEFKMDPSLIPSDEGEEAFVQLRHEVEARFKANGEPGILILFMDGEPEIRVAVCRTNEND